MSGVIQRNLKIKRRLYLKLFYWRPQTRHTHTQTDRHTDTHTHNDSIRRNAMCCISSKNKSKNEPISRNYATITNLNLSKSRRIFHQEFTFSLACRSIFRHSHSLYKTFIRSFVYFNSFFIRDIFLECVVTSTINSSLLSSVSSNTICLRISLEIMNKYSMYQHQVYFHVF